MSSAVSSLSVGNRSVKAYYNGCTNYGISNDTLSGGQSVRGLTTTTVNSNANPSTYGQPVTFTANVSGPSGAGTPTGTVQFQVDGMNFGSPVPLSGGSAVSSATSSLSVGNHSVSAAYSGDTTSAPSTGGHAGGQIVNQASSTTNVNSNHNPSFYHESVTFSATVLGTSGGSTPPAPCSSQRTSRT